MSSIVHAWFESFKLFKPNDLMMFLLLVLRAWFEALKTILFTMWSLFCLGCLAIIFGLPRTAWIAVVAYWFWVNLFAARPSVVKKDLGYFLQNSPYIVLFFFVVQVFQVVPLYFLSAAPFFFLMMFFIADSGNRVSELLKAPSRAALMSFKKLPVCLIAGVVLYGSSLLSCWVIVLVAIPWTIVFMSRCYVIWLHKGYRDYYEGC